MSRVSLGTVLLVLTSACAHNWERIDVGRLPGANEYPDSRKVILLDEVAIRFLVDPDTGRAAVDKTIRRRVRYLGSAEDQQSRVYAQYSKEFSKVLSIRARTVSPNGEQTEVDLSKGHDVPVLGSSILHSDERAFTLPLPTVAAGSVVEYEYTVRYCEPRLFQFAHVFGDDDPTAVARLAVSAPTSWDIEWLVRELDRDASWAPRIERGNGENRWTWEKERVPAIPTEPYAVPLSVAATEVNVRLRQWTEQGKAMTAFRDATELSAFFYELAVKKHTITPQIRRKVEEVLRGVPSDLELRAKKIHAYVCDTIDTALSKWGMAAGYRMQRTTCFASGMGIVRTKRTCCG